MSVHRLSVLAFGKESILVYGTSVKVFPVSTYDEYFGQKVFAIGSQV